MFPDYNCMQSQQYAGCQLQRSISRSGEVRYPIDFISPPVSHSLEIFFRSAVDTAPFKMLLQFFSVLSTFFVYALCAAVEKRAVCTSYSMSALSEPDDQMASNAG